MREYEIDNSNIGVALFDDEPQEIAINFPNGDRLELEVVAMTQDLMVSMQGEGIKFDGYRKPSDALEHTKRIMRKIVRGGTLIKADGSRQELDEAIRDRFTSHVNLTKKVLDISRDLAEETLEEETKN